LTNRGERLGLFNFGTNLNDLLFDFGNREDFTQEVSKRIFESVKVQLPFVEIENIEVVSQERSQKTELNKKGLAGVEVQLVFSIPAARVTSQSIAVELNPGG
jgi:phage baseplate assembly protein W